MTADQIQRSLFAVNQITLKLILGINKRHHNSKGMSRPKGITRVYDMRQLLQLSSTSYRPRSLDSSELEGKTPL
jgi:hypothetical protein